MTSRATQLARRRRKIDERRGRALATRVGYRAVVLDYPRRKCGECTACCTVLAVEQIGKPAMEPCQHLLQISDGLVGTNKLACGGCDTYSSKPESCSAYACAYLLGHPLVDVRPDKCGVIMDQLFDPGTAGERMAAVNAREAWLGASKRQPAAAIVSAVAERQPVIVVGPDLEHKRLLGPPLACLELLREARHEASNQTAAAQEQLRRMVASVEQLLAEAESKAAP